MSSSSSTASRAPAPPSSFARTPSKRSTTSPEQRQSAIFVGKIPLAVNTSREPSASSSTLTRRDSSSSKSHNRNASGSSLSLPSKQPPQLSSSSSQQSLDHSPITASTSSSTFQRPPRSNRRPSLQNGLPSPPFTSSEGSGGGSVSRAHQPPPAMLPSISRHSSNQSEEDRDAVDSSLIMDGEEEGEQEGWGNQAGGGVSRRSSLASSRREQEGEDRDQRIRDLKERSVKILDHHASSSNARFSDSATPSPTRSSYRTPIASNSIASSSHSATSSSSSKAARRSSLPAPPPTSNGRLVKPPLRDDSGWEVSAGEETERAGFSSPGSAGGGGWGERRPNYHHSNFSESSAEGADYRLPSALASPSHERTPSLGSDGGISRRSSRSGGSRGGHPPVSLHTQSHSLSSLDPPSSPPPAQNSRLTRDSQSSLRTTALHRSQSTSTSSSSSSDPRRLALQPRQGSDSSSGARVLASPSSLRQRGGSPAGSLQNTLRVSPSVRSARGSLASLATSPTRNGEVASPSSRAQAPLSATRSTFASRQGMRSNSQASLASPFSSPATKTIGRSTTSASMTGGDEDESTETQRRERQSSGGSSRRRAPLPMEFRNEGGNPPGSVSPVPPSAARTPRTNSATPFHISNRRVERSSPSPFPDIYSASSSNSHHTNTSPRIARVLPPSRSRTIRGGNGYKEEEERPKYTRRGGSAESALAGGGGSDVFEQSSKFGGAKEILARIERETAEREAKKRELLESQALRRAESVMAFGSVEREREPREPYRRPESSMSRTEDFNRKFPPRTPVASGAAGTRLIRQTPQTMAPLRPSTAMGSIMDDAPRTAPSMGSNQLRTHRSIYNIQAAAAREDASPSPSQLLRSRNAMNNDRSGTPTRAPTLDRTQSLRRAGTPSSSYHARAMTSIDFPSSSSSISNFSSNPSSAPVENMVRAFAHLETYYSPLALSSSDALIHAANGLMSSAEATNTSIAHIIAFTRSQIVDAEVNDAPLDTLDGLHQVVLDLREAKKTSDEEIRQLVDLMAVLPKLGRELSAGGGAGRVGSDEARFGAGGYYSGVRSRHSSLEKTGGSPLMSRTESRRSVDFHSRDGSEPGAPSRFADTRPSSSQAQPHHTQSPSNRFTTSSTSQRPRLPSIPSIREFANAAAVSSSSSTVPPAPFPRYDQSSASPPPKRRTSVLGHVFDRFSRTDEHQQPDRTYRQNKVSSTSTVRATSLFPSGPKVSEPTTAISTVTATHGSPLKSKTETALPDEPLVASPTSSFLTRARTISLHPSAERDNRRLSFAEDDAGVGGEGMSRRTSQGSSKTSEESDARRRRMSLPPAMAAGSQTSTSPGSVMRRLGMFGGGSPKKSGGGGLP